MEFTICVHNVEHRDKQTFQPAGKFGVTPLVLRSTLQKRKKTYLPNGHLTVRCRICISSFMDTMVGFGSNETLLRSMERLLVDGTVSDFTIACNGEKFACHKAILANKSDVFRAMFESRDWGESNGNVLAVDDIDTDTIRNMLEFVYTNKLSSHCTDS